MKDYMEKTVEDQKEKRQRKKYKTKTLPDDSNVYKRVVFFVESFESFGVFVCENKVRIAEMIESICYEIPKSDFSMHSFLGIAKQYTLLLFKAVYYRNSNIELPCLAEKFPGQDPERVICLCTLAIIAKQTVSENKRVFLSKSEKFWKKLYEWLIKNSF